MNEAKFILSQRIVQDQINLLVGLGLKVSYSYKTNKEVGNLLQQLGGIDFSIHSVKELELMQDLSRVWFFTQAQDQNTLVRFLHMGLRNFVVDNEKDLNLLLDAVKITKKKINLSLRMKFQEHRIGSGKYFVYGMDCSKVRSLLKILRKQEFVGLLGVHIHRKSQNTSEWEIVGELKDSLEGFFDCIDFVNLGGGLPSVYRSSNLSVLPYILNKLKEAVTFLQDQGIVSYIEPGRFVAAPSVRLETEIIQIQDKNLVINTSLYNCALDTLLTGTKMLVKGELNEEEKGEYYLLKGNSPTRDDIFRYKVKLKEVKVGDKIVFLNAGAYNYATDFFGYNKLKTEVVSDFS